MYSGSASVRSISVDFSSEAMLDDEGRNLTSMIEVEFPAVMDFPVDRIDLVAPLPVTTRPIWSRLNVRFSQIQETYMFTKLLIVAKLQRRITI